jgi:putative SOS response-associated peptidase YedK
MKDGRPFAFAGLAERWLAADGEVVDSCAIVTTTANTLLQPVHERMPVIVAPADYERWLDVGGEPPLDLVAPFASSAMTLQPVSTRVNSVRNDDAGLLTPLAADAAEAATPDDTTPAPSLAESPQQDLF